MFEIESYLQRNFEDMVPYGNPQTDWAINCIKCDDDKHHLNVSIEKQAVHCWRCGYSTSWIGFVMDNSGLKYHQALAELYTTPRMVDFDKRVKEPAVLTRIKDAANLPSDFELLTDVDDSYAAYKNYMIGRGFKYATWSTYGIGVSASIPGRIIIPIEKGYWQGRSIYSWLKPKYTNPKSEARDIIFNSAALYAYDEVVVCEGAFSAMAVGLNAVALIGKEAPDDKLFRLITSPVKHFIIALEQNAWGTVRKFANALYKNDKQVTIWRYTVGDPADKVHKFDVLEYNTRTRIALEYNM